MIGRVSLFVLHLYIVSFFFFSSRRRHTRYWRDWSSDVCSSDLDILVVNHALLLANIASDGGAFGTEGRHLVLDEAHALEKYISEAFGASVSRHRVYYVCNALERKVEDIGKFTARVRGYAESFFEELKRYTTLGAQDDAPPSYRELLKALVSVQELVKNNPRSEVNKLSGMVGRLKGDLVSFYEPLKDTHAYDVVV